MLSSQQHQPYLQLHHLHHPHHHQTVIVQQQQQQISGNNYCVLVDSAGSGSNNNGGTVISGQQQQQLVCGTTTGNSVSTGSAAVASMVQPLLNNSTSNYGNNTNTCIGISGNCIAATPATAFQSLLKPSSTTTTTIGGSTTATLTNGLQQPGAWFFPPQQQLPPDQLDFDQQLDGSPSSPGLVMGPQQLLARFGPRHCTESVEVPSSEHVAEIVGRQGCKIKALRAKTNTYIKTPVRGEEPVFVVTGRHEDVAEARREIECAAEHFTQIRASRRHSQGGCPAPGHVTAYVRVPLRVVGLVVGPKGNTIKRIQQDTHTYIITPSREREPIFEVTGLPQNVEAARREIENHIYQRTGNMPITDSNASVANYDLHVRAAALQAQQSAFHSQLENRPNYGALAVNNSNTSSSRNMLLMQLQQQMQQSSPSPYQQNVPFSSNNTGADLYNHFNSSAVAKFDQLSHHHGSHHHLLAFTGCGGSERAASPVQSNHQHSFVGAANGISNGFSTGNVATASANNLNLLLNALELDTSMGTGQSKTKAQLHGNSMFGSQAHHNLLRSISTNNNNNNNQLSTQQRQQRVGSGTASAFMPWNNNSSNSLGNNNKVLAPKSGYDIAATNNNNNAGMGNGTVDFLDMISSSTAASPSPLFFSSSNSNGCQSTFSSLSMAGLLVGSNNNSSNGVIGGGPGPGGLSSIHSSSRDEGLGDSPTNSFGRPHGADPYQHLMTIWTDLGIEQPVGGGHEVKHAAEQQAAAAATTTTVQNAQIEQQQKE